MVFPSLIGCNSTPISSTKETAKTSLVSSILDKGLHRGHKEKMEISLYYDQNGCPHLCSTPPLKLNVSFSYCNSKLWAAIALNFPIGIDVESANSFSKNYPFDYIFGEDEQNRFGELAEESSIAAAGMWSCKEAVVKSRKSGFSDLGPLDVQLGTIKKAGNLFEIEIKADQSYKAIALKSGRLWRTLAGPKRLIQNA